MSQRRKRKVSDETRLAIYRRAQAGENVKVLECDYGLSRATTRDCMNNETRARAILAQAHPAPGAEGR